MQPRNDTVSAEESMIEVGQMSTNYVQTRWYRAPELLLNNKFVSKQTDIWSVGCIFAELLGSDVLFKGSSPIEQIEQIVKILGTPPISEIKGSKNGVEFVKQLPPYRGIRSFSELLPDASQLALDLLTKMLHFNFEKRISASSALKHPYFSELYDESSVILPNKTFDFSFERTLINSEAIKRECYNTIIEFHGMDPEKGAGSTPSNNISLTPGNEGHAGISPSRVPRKRFRSSILAQSHTGHPINSVQAPSDDKKSQKPLKKKKKLNLVAKMKKWVEKWKH